MPGPRVAVLDHGMGNLRSVAKALEAAGADVVVTTERADIDAAAALCVPGQGIFGRCIANVERLGLRPTIARWIASGRPYLGICLGVQILFDGSDESDVPGLGALAGRVRRLPGGVPVPHIGWNSVAPNGSDGDYFYFDHSYALHPADPSIVTGWTEHGERFAASIRAGAAVGVQFHPEKSSAAGIAFLSEWVGSL